MSTIVQVNNNISGRELDATSDAIDEGGSNALPFPCPYAQLNLVLSFQWTS